MGNVRFIAAAVFSSVVVLGSLTALAETAYDYPQPIEEQYLFSTGRIAEPLPAERKGLWDYLSFFAWSSEPEEELVFPAEEASELRFRVRELSRQLLLNANETFVDEYVLTVNSFVNLNNLYKTSSLGRYISEQMIGELQMAGAEVIDVRKSAGIMVKEGHGEYGLSREMEELSYIHDSQAMVVGTYTHAQGQMFLNVRLLRNSDGMVLSNGSIVFALDPVTKGLLADESMPARRRGSVVSVQAYN